MASAGEHAETVLAAIVPGRRDLLERALRTLTDSHFPERVHSALFTLLQRYSDATGGAVLPAKYLEDAIRDRADPGQLTLYLETYELLANKQVEDSDFVWSLQQLRELSAERATGDALTDAMTILRTGKTLRTGETLKGHEEARHAVLESFQNIDRELTMQDAPEGDIREERIEILNDYAERKRMLEQGAAGGVLFGIEALDRKISGMQNGEVILTAGYSSDGKTTLCVQAAWAAAVQQGKNVVFFTTETLRDQVRRKLLSRHSMLPQFDIPTGLNSRDLKAGTLTPEDEAKLPMVVDDLTRNPAYGRVYIAQVPRSGTVATLDQRLNRIQRMFDVEFVVMDYLALLHSERTRQTSREELASIMKDAKLLATSFENGRGVPFMSPWQVSRAAREEAEKVGIYTSRALSETAEATNSADIIISLLAPTDNTERRTDITMQVLKNRDGETANGLLTEVDYATSWFRSKNIGLGGFPGSSSGGSSFDSLIS